MASHRVEFSVEDMDLAINFAESVVNDTYNRLRQDMNTRVFRLLVGKLGEIAVLRYCEQHNVSPNVEGMFEIYQGQTNVDEFDFVLQDGRKLDVKTGNQPFHRLIIVPIDQFTNQVKDIYVGVYVNVREQYALIHGYITRGEMANTQPRNRGEGPGYEWRFDQMHDFDDIVHDIA